MVKFSFSPRFHQGGAHIQLCLRIPEEQIQAKMKEYEKNATKVFVGGNTNVHMNEKEGMPSTFFYTSNDDKQSFPDDYKVIIFDKLFPEAERPEGFYWNHGESHGVAISQKRSEIVYWAESW